MVQNNYNYSGTFEVEECKIFTHNGEPLDLVQALVAISVFEDINQGFLTCHITVLDTNDIVLRDSLVGNEFCYLKIVTPSDEDVSLDFTKDPLIVTSIRQADEGQGRIVSFTLATREFMRNSRTRISQSFSGNMTEIIKRLVKEKQFLGSDKTLLADSSVGLERIVIPNLKPLTAIQMIAQRAKTKKDSPFVFFETIKGFNFLSFDSINRQNTKTTFTLGTSDTYDNKPSKSSQVQANIIRQLGQVEENDNISNSVLLNTLNGMYSSRMILHDIYNKTYHDLKFRYSDAFSKKNDIENSIGETGHPVFPISSQVDEDGKTVEDFHDSYLTLQSTSGYNTPKGSVHNINPYPNTIYPFEESSVSENLLIRNHKMSFLDRMGMTIKMVGNLSIQASDIIRLNVYKAKTDTDNEEEDLYDERLTGRYVISRLRHNFEFGRPKKHTIEATVIKDSVTKPYPNNLPPNPKRLI